MFELSTFLQHLSFITLFQIIVVDILLGADNAILIGLACRNLPQHLRAKGILWGTVGAIVLRILILVFAAYILKIPYFKILAGLLLFWIAIKLATNEEEAQNEVHAPDKLSQAIRLIIFADVLMSVDNVVGVSAAIHAGMPDANPLYTNAMLIIGVLVSIPVVVWGSSVVLRLIDKFPMVITLGAAMLAYLSAGMIMTDPVVANMEQIMPYIRIPIPILEFKLNLLGITFIIAMLIIVSKLHKSKVTS